jgi:hypothetical protein
VRFGEVAADEATAAVRVESRATYNGVGRRVKAWYVIVAAGKGSFDAAFGSVFEGPTVSPVIHDVEPRVDELQPFGHEANPDDEGRGY